MTGAVEQIGRYRVTGELGRGAMGVVYRAEDPAIGRTVAVKTIRLADLTDRQERDRLRDRLFREARSAGILSHPNIVTIYDIAEEGGMAYVFMEFVNGPTLEQMLLSSQPPDKLQILEILRQTAVALDYAHGKGIVHRDIKPANIMINADGQAKITDFGVARILSQQLTQAGTIMGTPNYMSPEQVQGTPVDGRSDQFSLAVIAFELLTGEKPYAADSLPTLLYKIAREAPIPPRRLNPSLGHEVDEVLGRAFAKDPDGRFPSCADFVAALSEATNATPDWAPLQRGASESMETVATNSGTQQPTVIERLASAAAPPAAAPEAPSEIPSVSETPAPSVRKAEPSVAEERVTPAPVPAPVARRGRRREGEQRESSPVRLVLVIAAAVIVVALGALAVRKFGGPAEPDASQVPVSPVPVEVREQSAPPPSVSREPAPLETAAAPPPSASLPEIEPPKPVAREETKPPARMPVQPVSKPEAVKPAPGAHTVLLRSSPPGARVVSDGDEGTSCVTPCELPLSAGRHVLVFNLAGHRNATRIVAVPDAQDVMSNLDPMAGTLAVRSNPPGAAITLNGQLRPEKTPAMVKLPAGTYKIVLTLEGRPPFEDTVEVKDQVISNISVDW